MGDLAAELLDPNTPDEVEVTERVPSPIADPTLGIALTAGDTAPAKAARHGLVTVGDSLTHGVMSGAVFHTELSFPALVAEALGIDDFTVPGYGGPLDGLPANLETLTRRLESVAGTRLRWWEMPAVLLRARALLDRNEDYWERGGGSTPPSDGERSTNLGIYGWDLRDALSVRPSRLRRRLDQANRDDQFFAFTPVRDNDLAALTVLNPFGDATQIEAAQVLGDDGGIDTLMVALGANNVLDAVVNKVVRWSDSRFDQLDTKDRYNVWRPSHFALEYGRLAAALAAIDARRVVLATVPHVTIVPFAKGVNPQRPGQKWRAESRYFPYYADPWISDRKFDPAKHRHLTHQQARALDSAIDQYNVTIASAVRGARERGEDWLLFDLCGLLDRLAHRRYLADERAQTVNRIAPYSLPPALAELSPPPDTRFFLADDRGRLQGGLFSLDGIHPTTIGYGLVADELTRLLSDAGVPVPNPIDFGVLLSRDSLVAKPPPLWLPLFDALDGVLARFRSRGPST